MIDKYLKEEKNTEFMDPGDEENEGRSCCWNINWKFEEEKSHSAPLLARETLFQAPPTVQV